MHFLKPRQDFSAIFCDIFKCIFMNEKNHVPLFLWFSEVCYSGFNWQYVHYDDVITGAMASQFTGLTVVYSAVYSDAEQRKYQSSASLAFVRGIHRGPVNSLNKWPVTRKMAFHDVIMSALVNWFRYWLIVRNKWRQIIFWTNNDPIYQCLYIYMSLYFIELINRTPN